MENYKEILPELKEHYGRCNELFEIAWRLNGDENTRTEFSKKLLCYTQDMMQTLGYLIGTIEKTKYE